MAEISLVAHVLRLDARDAAEFLVDLQRGKTVLAADIVDQSHDFQLLIG